jgi:hypothetical protein
MWCPASLPQTYFLGSAFQLRPDQVFSLPFGTFQLFAGTSRPRQVKMKPELVIAPVPIVRDFSADLGSWTGTAAE